jgi:AcrR family transcriptional regulator
MTSDRHKSTPDLASAHRDPALTGSDHAVLDAAREAILDVGWRRTTLTDVARRAGVSRMTLYRRWPDMRGLLGDLMTREWTAAMETVTQRGRPGESLLEQVRRGVVQVARAIRDDELFAKIIRVDPELLLPYLLDRRGRSQELVLALLEPLLRAGQQSKQIRAGDTSLIARSLLLTAQGFTLSVQTMTDPSGEGPGEADFEAELGLLVERYLAP